MEFAFYQIHKISMAKKWYNYPKNKIIPQVTFIKLVWQVYFSIEIQKKQYIFKKVAIKIGIFKNDLTNAPYSCIILYVIHGSIAQLVRVLA